MHVVLIMVRENGDRRSFALSREVTLLGRREDADFRIPLTDISRKHCRFVKDGKALLLEDLGSANGTLRNGKRIKQCELDAGDTVQIGPVKFVVQIDGVPALDEAKLHRPRVASPNGSASGRHAVPPPTPPGFDSSVPGGGSATLLNDDDNLLDVEPTR